MLSEAVQSAQDSVTQVRCRLDQGGISIRQGLIVLVCFLVNFVDGYDVIAIAMAAPTISREWGIAPETLGYILSAELLGMTVGAVVLAGMGDRFGRRTVLIPSVLLVAVSTFITAYTETITQLVSARLATGLGVGGVLTAAATLASEFVPSRSRAAVVTLVTTGFAVGSLLAGVVAAYSLEHYNWQMIFLVGSAMGGVILVLALLFVPESMEFLASRRVAGEPDRQRINKTLALLGLQPLATLTPPDEKGGDSVGIATLLGSDFRKLTLLLWSLFFALFWANYGAGKWFPKLLVGDGFEISDAVFALTVWVLGGVAGSLSISLVSLRFSMTRIIGVFLFFSIAIVVVFAGIRPDTISALYPLMFLLGLGVSGAMTAMYSIPVTSYPTQLRGLGLGCCIGIGRTGAIFAPIVTGYLVGAGAGTGAVLLQVTLPSVVAALAILALVGKLYVRTR